MLSYSQQPNSDSVGFQSLGWGAEPRWENIAGTLLALGWNPWETGETLLESCWKVAEVSNLAGALRELCWNLAGTW